MSPPVRQMCVLMVARVILIGTSCKMLMSTAHEERDYIQCFGNIALDIPLVASDLDLDRLGWLGQFAQQCKREPSWLEACGSHSA